jgi:hypothetical protein
MYEDDQDYGSYFLYSGCGGKVRDKNKRMGVQVVDQELKRHNKLELEFVVIKTFNSAMFGRINENLFFIMMQGPRVML